MDIPLLHFLSSLVGIIIIDLALAGDNAIVIAMAAKRLPAKQQKQAIIWGTLGAIIIRSILTVSVVYLLKLPSIMLVGGVLLLPIAWKLLHDNNKDENAHITASVSFIGAIRTIVVADTLMGMDNVLGVAGAANGHIGLVIIGLLISIPMIVWGSTLILKWLVRYPALIYIGAATIAWTSARMIGHDTLTRPWFALYPAYQWLLDAVLVIGVCVLGYATSRYTRLRKTR